MERGIYFDRDYAGAVTELYERGLNRRDPQVVETLLAPDVVVHRLGSGEETEGRGAYVAEQAAWLDAVPDYHVAVEDVVVDADRVVARLTCYGTPVKPCEAAQPTGRSFAVSALHEFRFEDGRVVEAWLLDDRMAMVRQLGLLPSSVGDVLRVAGHRLRWLLFGRPRTARGRTVEPDGEPTDGEGPTEKPPAGNVATETANPTQTAEAAVVAAPSPRAADRLGAARRTVNKDCEVESDGREVTARRRTGDTGSAGGSGRTGGADRNHDTTGTGDTDAEEADEKRPGTDATDTEEAPPSARV